MEESRAEMPQTKEGANMVSAIECANWLPHLVVIFDTSPEKVRSTWHVLRLVVTF